MSSAYLNSSINNYYSFIGKSRDCSQKKFSPSEEIYYFKEMPEKIKELTSRFLFPYITNQVTPEHEKKRSISFLEIATSYLKKSYDKKNISSKFHSFILKSNELKNFILSTYLEKAIQGLFSNHHLAGNTRIPGQKKTSGCPKDLTLFYAELSPEEQQHLRLDQEYTILSNWYRKWLKLHKCNNTFANFTKPVLILLQALKPAIDKDFSTMELTPNELIQKTLLSLKEFSHNRKVEYKEVRTLTKMMRQSPTLLNEPKILTCYVRSNLPTQSEINI